jgi:predicted lactoylglutathione lyase
MAQGTTIAIPSLLLNQKKFMKTQKIWANLAVDDLDRTTRFYTQLGFKPHGASKDLTSFFVGEDDFIIHFFLKAVLKANVPGELADLQNGNEVVFTLSAGTREQVDNWEREVQQAGGTIVSAAAEFGQGYYGFVFTDPDGHKFNVFHM